MNLKQNFSDKIHYFSTIKINKKYFFSKEISLKSLSYKIISTVTDRYEWLRNFTNKVRVFRATLEPETSVARSETGSGSGVGAETSLKVGSGSGVGSETNHS
jgi:hypothetical protein